MISKALKLLTSLTLLSALSGCTLNEGDPQVTLCQKLTGHLMSVNDEQWKQPAKSQGKDKSMNVTVHWDSQEGGDNLAMQATCVYLSDEFDEGKEYELGIEDEYRNLPESITINGKAVRQKDLYTAIQKVTGQSVKDTFNEDHLRKKAAEADQAVRQGATAAANKASETAEALKKGGMDLKQKAGDALQKAGEHLKK